MPDKYIKAKNSHHKNESWRAHLHFALIDQRFHRLPGLDKVPRQVVIDKYLPVFSLGECVRSSVFWDTKCYVPV